MSKQSSNNFLQRISRIRSEVEELKTSLAVKTSEADTIRRQLEEEGIEAKSEKEINSFIAEISKKIEELDCSLESSIKEAEEILSGYDKG